jgi:hypothetical protein
MRELIQRLWKLFQTTTGAPDDQIVIGIQLGDGKGEG